MKYMLDTNIIIYTINNRNLEVVSKFRKHSPNDMCISSITMAELEYGVCNSSKPAQNRFALLGFLSGIEILPFDAKASREYGMIRHQLKKNGTPIGNNDLLIASHAKSLNLKLITNNIKEFRQVEGLDVESWS